MARRGETLREHILWKAKETFLEMGFERASMDVVAARAETSKRTLYAHFESKEGLFLAVVGLVRRLFLDRMQTPGDYGEDPAEALTLFCGRYLESMLYEANVQMCRLGMAEATRFAEGTASLYGVVFAEVQKRLADYLATQGLAQDPSEETAARLMGEILFPRWPRVLFGLEPSLPRHDGAGVSPGFDLAPVRAAVARTLAAP